MERVGAAARVRGMGMSVVTGAEAPPLPAERLTHEQPGTFEEFYRGQADRVHRALAVTLGDNDLAREATDEAMARAYARWRRVSELDNPGGWVFRVGLNWATSRWRKRSRERPLPEDLELPGPPSSSPSDVDDGSAVTALRQLNTASRAVVVCRVLLELSTAETASVLGVAEGTVKSRLARALSALRTALTEEDES